MLSENVPASLLTADTRWPGEQRKTSIQFGGSSVPAALSFGLTIAMRHPPVEDTEPGKHSWTAYVCVPKAWLDAAAPPTEATDRANAVPRGQELIKV